MPGFFSALADLLGIEPWPGTAAHRDVLHRAMKQRNDELGKRAEQRDPARLLELTQRVLRLRIEAAQARAYQLRSDAALARMRQDMGCCGDCPRVRLRVAAALMARAVWHEEWVRISALRLQAVEQGQPYPPLTLPYPEAQPHLAEGVPLDFPPSIDRCAACQKELEEPFLKHLHRCKQTLVTNGQLRCNVRRNAARGADYWRLPS